MTVNISHELSLAGLKNAEVVTLFTVIIPCLYKPTEWCKASAGTYHDYRCTGAERKPELRLSHLQYIEIIRQLMTYKLQYILE